MDYLASWAGRARIQFHHAAAPIKLPSASGIETSLHDVCKSATPPCTLNPLLCNGHLQTAWTAVKAAGPPIVYRRKIFEAEDVRFAGCFAVDFVASKGSAVPAASSPEEDETLPPRTTYFSDDEWAGIGSEDSKPMLISLHGLSGGSHEIYLRHVLAPLVEEQEGDSDSKGWEALVVNSRGCAMSEITSGVLYNARATWDMRQVVKWCRATLPNRPLYAVGYSLGANILTNYLGEEGDACQLQAAVIVANPWKLEVASLALQRSWLGLNVYSKVMGKNMKKLIERHEKQIMRSGNIDVEAVRKITYLHEFDRAIQVPTWGYPTEGAYYRDASSVDSIFNIRTPTFCLNAEDDPIAVQEAIPYEEIKQNPYTVLCTTSMGGHLSWFEVGGSRWHVKPVCNFLQAMAHSFDAGKVAGPSSEANLADGTRKGAGASGYKSPFEFQPMRRKMPLRPVEGARANVILEK